MFCSQCGVEVGGNDNFCKNCGVLLKASTTRCHDQPRQAGRWEYKDLHIPMRFPYLHADEPQVRDFDRIILDELSKAGREGWQAEHPTSYGELLRRNCLELKQVRAKGFWGGRDYIIVSVRIRVKRWAEG